MLRYILRRFLLAVPTLLIISFLSFGLNKCAPGDPVREVYGQDLASTFDPEAQARIYGYYAAQLGLDRPEFYFGLTNAVYPDTLYRIFPPERKQRLRALTAQSGHWPTVSQYERQLSHAIRVMEQLPDSLPQKASLREALSNLLSINRLDQLPDFTARLAGLRQNVDGPMQLALDSLLLSTSNLQTASHSGGFPQPVLHWHGFDNQYHNWLTGFISGHFGTSYSTKKPVSTDLYYAFWPTLLINGLALVLAYLMAVPLGVAMARRRRQKFDTWTRRALLFLYAVPVFWLGGLLILFFATPGFGIYWIDGITLEPWQGSGKSFFEWVSSNASKFVLPVATLTAHALAVLALQMRGGMLDVVHQDFIRTARAKGAAEGAVYWRHAFRNALFPVVTVLASVFPAVFGGSLIVEYLFQYPGMGMKAQEAFMTRDFPVLSAILVFSALLTILSNLMADLLYGYLDPRVRFGQRGGR